VKHQLMSKTEEMETVKHQLMSKTEEMETVKHHLISKTEEVETVKHHLISKTEEMEKLEREKAIPTTESPVNAPVFSNQIFGEAQQSSAASFFEELSGSSAVELVPAVEAVPAVQPAELYSLQEELRQKVASSLELSEQLEQVKLELQCKLSELAELEAKSEQLMQGKRVAEEENVSLRSQVSQLQQTKTEASPSTAASLFTEPLASSEAPPSIAASFFTEASPSAASSFFTEASPPPAASLFTEAPTSSETPSSTAASLFTEAPSEPVASMLTEALPAETGTGETGESLPSVSDLSQDQMVANLAWYQSQLGQYQQACQDWTVWGDEKAREISELSEHLSYQTEAFRIKAAETEKLKEKLQEVEETDKKNDQSMMKLKDLEILDLNESLERLESEKSELQEEISEMRSTIAELRSVSESVENYRDDSADLLDTRTKLEEVERERTKISSELSDLRNEMATTQFSNDKTIKDLRKDIEEKLLEIEEVTGHVKGLESSLAEERKMQEEIGDEYEKMQQQVQDCSGRLTELQLENDKLKEQAEVPREGNEEETEEKVKHLTSELEQYQQTCSDWQTWGEARTLEYQQLLEAYNGYVEAYNNLQSEQQKVSGEEVGEVASLREQLQARDEELLQLSDLQEKYKSCLQDQQELDERLGQETGRAQETEERYQSSLQKVKDLEKKLVESSSTGEEREERYKSDLQQLQQSISTGEEREVLLKSELEERQKQISELQQSQEACRETQSETSESESKAAEYETLLEAYNQYVVAYDYLNTEYGKLQLQLQQPSHSSISDQQAAVDSFQVQLQEKEAEVSALKQAVESKEKELVEKTATVAKLSLSSALAAQMSRPEKEKEEEEKEEEGWGLETAEIQQSPASQDVLLLESEISELRVKLRAVEEEKKKALEDLNSAKLKSGKLLVKVKQLTKEVEALKRAGKSGGELDDLDKALQDEMRLQSEKTQNELKEVKKELENIRLEKTTLVRKVDTLEAGNERLVELKEQQDNEVEFLQFKLKDLSSKVDAQQWEMTELAEQRMTELTELRGQLSVLSSGSESSERLEVASLSSQLAVSRQETERLSSDLAVLSQSLLAAQTEAATVKSQTIDLQDSLDRLASEREDLLSDNQRLRASFSGSGSSADYEEIVKLNNSLNAEIASLKLYVQSGSPSVASPDPLYGRELDQLRDAVRSEQQLVVQLERDLQLKEESLRSLEEELFLARDCKLKKEEELRSRESQSLDREVFTVFSDKNLVLENQKLRTDLDNVSRERRQLSERISSWEEQLGREDIDVMGEDGLRQELRVAIKTLQLRGHKCEEVTQENLRLLEERDTLMLRLSTTMRQLEGSRATSMAGSRATTPVPGVHQDIMTSFDPQAEIRGLHNKLEELRRLNYSLDVELQRERTGRRKLEEKVMSPRTVQADRMLAQSGSARESPKKVQHF